MPLSMNETMTRLRENFLYRGKNPEKFRLLSMVLVMLVVALGRSCRALNKCISPAELDLELLRGKMGLDFPRLMHLNTCASWRFWSSEHLIGFKHRC
ncbi:hypothetical protein K470DRAFT_97121 [Piedraia hortae CBS 480.64]|uniref:Uncharacterized protein n=1 Tax=Piedraia hortae CBS 480.64 TaxID=1314780 RepID=A0A6A7BWL6_9PEZI|nr:hypothetical protein K470DRAFT_97121 [Piedraia hortae CBS 480.64]